MTQAHVDFFLFVKKQTVRGLHFNEYRSDGFNQNLRVHGRSVEVGAGIEPSALLHELRCSKRSSEYDPTTTTNGINQV